MQANFTHLTIKRLVDEGRLERALEVVDEGALCAREQRMDEELLACLLDKALVRERLGQREAALAALDEGVDVAADIPDPSVVLPVLAFRASMRSSAWRQAERLIASLHLAAGGAEDLSFACWGAYEKACVLAEEGELETAAALYAALTETPYPRSISGVPLAPEAGLAAALRQLGCLRAAATVVIDAEAAYDDERVGSVRCALLLAERASVLEAIGRDEAAEDVRRSLGAIAPGALRRLEARILELAGAAGRRPTSYLTIAMGQWESIARALGDRATIVRCWLPPDTALASLDPAGVAVRQTEALRTASEVALLHADDRLFRRIHALMACVRLGGDEEL